MELWLQWLKLFNLDSEINYFLTIQIIQLINKNVIMKVHIYRPHLFTYSYRNYKIFDETNQLINSISDGSEVILENPTSSIKLKVDWRRGSYSFEDNQKESQYLICYFTQKNIFSLVFPSSFKNFIKLKEVSKEAYREAIATQGKSLPFFCNSEVSSTKAMASRFLSGFELLTASILFYQTDYSGLKVDEDIGFIRVLGVILFIGGVLGLIWNINKNMKILQRGVVEIGLIIYIAYHIGIIGGQINWFIFPIVGMMSVIAFYFYRKNERELC